MLVGINSDDGAYTYWYDITTPAQYERAQDLAQQVTPGTARSLWNYTYSTTGDPADYQGVPYGNFRGYGNTNGYSNIGGYDNYYGYNGGYAY